MVCSERLAGNFQRLSAIGAEAHGGITRLAFSDTDWEARAFVIRLMEQAGLRIRIDAFGNVIGRREGLNPAASVVMLGSHVDSVPNGGNYDGIVGVLGAIEVLQCLEDAQETYYHPIEVVVFMAEESSRFGVATLGSKVFCGKIKMNELDQFIDQQGIMLPEAMRRQGLTADKQAQAAYTGEIKAFLELHIEQGKVLETLGKQLGIVTGIAAPTRMRIVIEGQADHSGATPMNMRRDALTAAAEVILAVEALAEAAAKDGIVGTTGIIQAEPGVMNVIPGRAELGIDIRGTLPTVKQSVLRQLYEAIDRIKSRRQVAAAIKVLTDEVPVSLSAEMVEFLESVNDERGASALRMPSGAGHDAMHLAGFTHTGLVFIPCRAGISHNPAEWAELADIVAGTELLLAATRKLAQKEFGWKTAVGAK